MFHWRCFVVHSFISLYFLFDKNINRLAQYINARENRRNNNGATEKMWRGKNVLPDNMSGTARLNWSVRIQ